MIGTATPKPVKGTMKRLKAALKRLERHEHGADVVPQLGRPEADLAHPGADNATLLPAELGLPPPRRQHRLLDGQGHRPELGVRHQAAGAQDLREGGERDRGKGRDKTRGRGVRETGAVRCARRGACVIREARV